MASTHQLRGVEIGDAPEAWRRAGFAVDGDRFVIARTVFHLVGPSGGRGIRGITVDGIAADIDGLPFTGATADPPPDDRGHANGVVDIDHLVAMSPDMDRTSAALVGAGLELRRTRTFGDGAELRRQAFFWLGDVILELAGLDRAHEPGPASLWGLALTTTDLDAAGDALGDAMGDAKDAVQPGRRIATIRTRDLGISVPVALMTPHRARSEP